MARLYHRLQVAAHLLKKHADRLLLDAAGITTAQAAVLVVVAEDDPNQRAVASRLRISEPAVTGMVERLTTAGLVERRRSDTDGRAWLLRLTTPGRDALAAARGAFTEVNELLSEAIGNDRVGQLDTDLADVIRELTKRMDSR